MKIKRATAEEQEWAADLMSGSDPWVTLRVTREKCLIACFDAEHLLYIASISGQPLGLILLHPHGLAGSPYIKSVCVSETARGKGIGAAMLDYAENLFKPESKHIFLCVSSFNSRAQILYERLGYHKVGEFKDYVLEGKSEILMHKLL
jgi:ribosomal protein S18 acetylase RimI-like enzyme